MKIRDIHSKWESGQGIYRTSTEFNDADEQTVELCDGKAYRDWDGKSSTERGWALGGVLIVR